MSYSDPITVINNIISSVESLGFSNELDLDFNEMKKGFGLEVCFVLIFLIDKIFKERGFSYK